MQFKQFSEFLIESSIETLSNKFGVKVKHILDIKIGSTNYKFVYGISSDGSPQVSDAVSFGKLPITVTANETSSSVTSKINEFIESHGVDKVTKILDVAIAKANAASGDTQWATHSIYVNSRNREVIVISSRIYQGKEIFKEESGPKFIYLGLKYNSSREDLVTRINKQTAFSKFKFKDGEDFLK